jgi:hypothetical protein
MVKTYSPSCSQSSKTPRALAIVSSRSSSGVAAEASSEASAGSDGRTASMAERTAATHGRPRPAEEAGPRVGFGQVGIELRVARQVELVHEPADQVARGDQRHLGVVAHGIAGEPAAIDRMSSVGPSFTTRAISVVAE